MPDDCSSAGFKSAVSITLDAAPFAIASADFNSDGHLDLVYVPNDISEEVHVLYGRGGTERFGPPNSFPAGGDARRVAVGDLNGDGKPDLVFSVDSFSLPSPRLSILVNDGAGKFGAPGFVNVLGDASQIVLADVNNDSKLDIVAPLFTGSSNAHVAILLGNGSGGFSQAANSPISTFSRNVAAIVVGDFNEDGKRDLALPGTLTGVDVFPGDGAGGFGPAINTAFTSLATFMIGGDFNEDGHLDLFIDNRMVLGTGSAGFSAPIVVDRPENTTLAVMGDLNHDNHLDVVTASSAGITIMLGNGTGNLARANSYTSGITAFAPVSSFGALGDFNEDGNIDIAGVQPLGIAMLDGDGTGAFNDALSYHTSTVGMRNLVAADFNNDGKKDFAIIGPAFAPSQGPSRVEVALGDGSGRFTRKSISNFGFVSQLSGIATADFNNDGKSDLAVTRSQNGAVSILLNDGTGGFPTDGFSVPSVFVGAQPSAIKAGDFNNDNKSDLVVITPGSNTFAVLLGDGSGGFNHAGSSTLQGTPSFVDDVDIGDFDADGKADIAIVRSGATVVDVRRGDGAGHFSALRLRRYRAYLFPLWSEILVMTVSRTSQ